MDGDIYSDEDRFYARGDSDESPLLSNRHEKHCRVEYPPPKEERPRRSTLSILAKLFIFSTAMILFCVLLYIPVYNKASDQFTKGFVEGWSVHTNRDTKIYVQPNNITSIHEPKNICDKSAKNKLFLIIIVCSSTVNFIQREAIRHTWGSQENYIETSKIYRSVKQKYSNYNFTYDLYSQVKTTSKSKVKRDISGFSRLLPALAEALNDNLVNVKTDSVPEKRFDDETLPEFDMNEVIGESTEAGDDYYDTNVMKIPPNGLEDTPDVNRLLKMLKRNKNFSKMKKKLEDRHTESEFKVVFLLGLPVNDNDTTIQGKIDEEMKKYGDVIQEGFIDSYNNLTIKSIMMLKWIKKNCGSSVRYILKTDDDMYVNVPNLIDNLKKRAKEFDAKNPKGDSKEYMLIGDLFCGARPVLDSNNKWFSPKYMYGGRVYPKYLSGTGYALSSDAANALYDAALRTAYFHLEDIFITGMCSARAYPRIVPRDDPLFSYQQSKGVAAHCAVHAHITSHRITPVEMYKILMELKKPDVQDECERIRLTKVRNDLLKPKPSSKKSKHS